MSKALALVAGIAVMTTALWFLFVPDTDGQHTTSSITSPAAGQPEVGDAPADRGDIGDSPQSASAHGSKVSGPVSLWPDPDATSALPARPDNPARNARPVVTLWQVRSHPTKVEVDGFPATRLKANPDALAGLHVGQQVVLPVPELGRTITARLTTTHNQLNNIKVFRGPVTGGHDKDNLIVTRGETSSHVVLSTREGVYSAVIDNRSGDAVLTSETDVQDNLAGQEDALPVPGIDQTPPGSPSG